MYSKIVGTTFRSDGQKLISKLKSGDTLKLVLEPTNKFDPNAVAVFHEEDHLGYIPSKTAQDLSQLIKRGAEVSCKVSEVTGGGLNNYGCNLIIDCKE